MCVQKYNLLKVDFVGEIQFKSGLEVDPPPFFSHKEALDIEAGPWLNLG